MNYIKKKEDFFQFEELFSKEESKFLREIRKIYVKYTKNKSVELIDSQIWRIRRHVKAKDVYKEYKVLIYHDKDNERFYSKVIPIGSLYNKLLIKYYYRKYE